MRNHPDTVLGCLFREGVMIQFDLLKGRGATAEQAAAEGARVQKCCRSGHGKLASAADKKKAREIEMARAAEAARVAAEAEAAAKAAAAKAEAEAESWSKRR